MLYPLILAVTAFVLFIVYNSTIIGIYGIPRSLSTSFYLLQDTKAGLGYVFSVFMGLTTGLLMPAWIEISMAVGPWMNNFTFLAFFCAAAICFVGAAPAFRSSKMEDTVHTVSALIAAAAGLLWCFIVCWQIFWVPLIGIAIAAILGASTKTWKTCTEYWLEMMAFLATFGTIITECALLM